MGTKTLHTLASAAFITVTLLLSQALRAQPTIEYATVTGGLSSPIEIAAPNDNSGRLFIVEQRGTIRIWTGTSLLPTPFLDITPLLSTGDEQGLLSMAFHPDYASNGLFFVYYTNTSGDITVARYSVSGNPNIANPTASPVTPLVTIPKPYDNHNGGHLQFKVEGGVNYLYFGTGDGGDGNDPNGFAQNPGSRLGKMIRIDVDAGVITPEIWAVGLRNPFRWSFDRATGDMWIGDVGQGLVEEVDFRAGGTSGANYGWRCFEGTIQNTDIIPLCSPAGTVVPVLQYPNPGVGSSAVTGGYVYHGPEFPALQGFYIATDFYSGQIWLIRSPSFGTLSTTTQTGLAANISAFGEAQDGTLYAVSLTGNVLYKVNAVGSGSLPLTLVTFSGNAFQGYNDLKWTTSAEESLDKFVVEYSVDGTNYQVAGEVTASGKSNGSDYTYRHNFNNPAKILYRLRIVDIDGSVHFSPVISLARTDHGGLRVYPTVITTSTVEVTSGAAIERIEIFTTDGKRVLAKNMNGVTGYFRLPLPTLQKGLYMVKFTGHDFQQTEKIMVQ
jgi:glucose/arabinose dehydrogenase